MDPFQLPENLTELSADELTELTTALVAASAEAQAFDRTALSTEQVEHIESLTAAHAAISAENERRSELAARGDAGLTALAAASEPAPVAEPVAAPAPPAPAEPVQAAVEPPAPAVEPAEPVQAAAEPVEVVTPDAVLEPAAVGSPAQLAAARPDELAPRTPAVPARENFMRSTGFVLGIDRGVDLADRAAVANAITETSNRMSRSSMPAGLREFVPLATSAWDREFAITADPEASFPAMWGAVQNGVQAIVASGACCTPLSPMYNFFRLAVPQNPVETCLPVMGAPRGGVRWIITPDWRDALAGIGTECCGDNDDPENPVLKPCVHVECPTLQEDTVCAISQCVEFGNLTYRTFPELVENFLDDLAVAFAVRKETFYLDAIHTASTAVTGIDTGYGMTRNFFFNLTLAAAGYRRRNGMRADAQLSVMVPAWVREAIKADMLNDNSEGISNLNVTDAMINAAFASRNLTPCWYVDTATGQGQAFNQAQGAGAINEWNSNALVYLFSPGTFVRLDGGTLDLGIVRDSTLNRRNDLQMFMEEWTQVVQLGIESVRLTIPVCPSGAAPELVPVLECAGS